MERASRSVDNAVYDVGTEIKMAGRKSRTRRNRQVCPHHGPEGREGMDAQKKQGQGPRPWPCVREQTPRPSAQFRDEMRSRSG